MYKKYFAKEVLICGLLVFSTSAKGKVEGVALVAGDAKVTHAVNETVIIQHSDKAILDWQSFNIAPHEVVRFQQPSVNSITLNRVMGGEASSILGKISANGKIILVNQAGIVFGNSAQVDVGGLIATTAEIANKDFMEGHYHFKQTTGNFYSVKNYGNIIARDGGIVALVAPAVQNAGNIKVRYGKVELVAGTEFTVDFYGDQLINLSVGSAVKKPVFDEFNHPISGGVSNTGGIFVEGGQAIIQANVAANVLDNVINLDGVIEANSIVKKNGQIILLGGKEGIVKVSGKIQATGKNSNEKGGNITITGQTVEIQESADINVSGVTGGGFVKIGGNKKGEGSLQKAEAIFAAKGSQINANAILRGNGGEVILWSEKATRFYGNITAKGGLQSGNGGWIETSGRNWADFGGEVNASATKGLAGTWVFDPTNVNIVAGSANTNGAFAAGNPQIWTPTATTPSTIGANNIVAFLNAGTNVTITTTSSGGDQGNITVQSSVVTSTAGGTQFTLIADNNITINSGVNITTQGSATFTAGLAGTFTNSGTNNLAVSGTTTITAPGGISFPKAFTLAGPMILNSSGANGNITLSGTVNGAQALTLSAGTGTITLGGILGGTTALSSLSVNSATLVNTTSITTTGLIQITPAVSLSANTTYASGAGDITFGSTIVSGGGVIRTLTLNSTGTTTLTGSVGAGGGTSALSTLTTNAGGTTVVGGNITTTNAAILFNDTVTLLADAVFSTGSGAITFGGTLNGAGNLTLNSTGATTFNNIVGGTTPLFSLTTNIGGTAVFAAACTGVKTSGDLGINIGEAVTFNAALTTLDSSTGIGPIVLGGAVTLRGNLTATAGSGAVMFGSTINGARNLIANSSGATTFTGIVGGTTALLSLITDGGGSTSIGANISTTNGPIVFNDPVTLAGNSVINSGTGSVTFGGTIEGPRTLTVNSTGVTTFAGNIGSVTPLLSLTTNAGGSTLIGGNISTTNGAVVFNDAVTLTADTLISSGTGLVTFLNTVNGNFALTVNSSGVTTFTGILGGTTPLSSLTTDALGSTSIRANISTTNGPIVFNDPVSLAANVVINSGTGLVTFGSTLNGARTLTVNSLGVTTFTGIVGGTTPLTGLTIDAGGSTSIGANILTTNGAIVFNDAVNLAANVLISSGTGLVTFGSTVDGPGSLTVNSTGATTFNNIIGGTTPLLSLTTNAGGTAVFAAACTSVKTNGAVGINIGEAVTFNGLLTTLDSSAGNGPIVLTGAVTLNGDLTVVSGNGLMTFSSTVNGAKSLTAAAGTGTITFSGILGGTTALTSLVVNSATLVNTTSITTTGLIQITPAVSLSANATYASGAGDITFGSTIVSGGGVIRTLTLNSTGTTTLTGAVGAGGGTNALSTLTTNAGGITVVGGNITTTNAAILFNDTATLLGDAVFSTGSGAITFGGTLNGAGNLTLNSTGATTFNNIIGGNAPLLGLTTNAGGTSVFAAACTSVTTSGPVGINIGEAVTFNGALTTLDTRAGNGPIVLTGAVTLNGDLTVTSGSGLITFGSTVSGARNLIVTSLGIKTFSGIVGGTALLSFTTNAAGSTSIGANISTAGPIIFNDPVTLTANSIISSGAGLVTFESTIDGPGRLTVNSTGTTTFNNIIGGTTPLLSLTTNAGGTAVFAAACTSVKTNGAVGINIGEAVTFNGLLTTLDSSAGNGPIVLTGAVTLNGDLTVVSGNGLMTFGSTVNGAKSLTAAAGTGTITFSGILGGSTALTSLVVNSAALVNTTSITTTGHIQITPAVSLSANTTYTSSTGDITFGSTIVSGGVIRTLTLNSTGTTTLTGAVGAGGGTNALSTLTTHAGGITVVGGNITTTNAAILFNDTVTLLGDAVFSTGSGAITFGGTLNGAGNLTLNSTGATTFNNIIGGNTPLLGLTTNAGGTSVFAAACTSVTTSGLVGINIGEAVTFNGLLTTLDSSVGNGPIVLTGAVTLNGDLTVTSGSGAITFGSTVSGARNLIVTSLGIKTFSGIVGGTALLSFTTNAAGSTLIGANISTAGPIIFNDPVTLTANSIISSGAGLVTFESTIDGPGRLTVNSTGTTTFNNIIGGNTPLLGLTTNAGGTSVFAAACTSVTTSGSVGINIGEAVTFNGLLTTLDSSAGNGPIVLTGAVTLNGDLTVVSGNGLMTFGSTVNGARSLRAAAGTGTITFSGILGGTTALTSLVVNSASLVNMTSITTTGLIQITPAVSLSANTTYTSSTGDITFGSTIVSGGGVIRTLTLNSTGTTTLTGAVGAGGGTNALSTLTTNAGGITVVGGNITTTNAAILFSDNVTLSGDAVFSTGSGVITFGGTLNGAGNLTLNSTGATTFNNIIGGSAPLLGLTTNAGGTSVFATACTSVTTSGPVGINIGEAVTFNGLLTTLDSSVGNGPIVLTGAVTLNGGLTAVSGNGLITFGSTVNGAQVLTAAAGTGTITFSGILGGTTALTSLVVNSASLVNMTNVTTTGLIQITPAVSLSANTTYTSSAGDITFGSTIVSGGGVIRTLTLNSTGTTTLTGAVGAGGGTNALSTLTTNAGGIIAVGGNIDTTNAVILFNDNVTLLGDAVFSTGSGAITFGGTLNGAGNLTLNSTGATTFNNIIGGNAPLLGLTTNVGGTSVFAAACTSVMTSGPVGINIGEAVTFNGLLTTLDSSVGNGPIVLTGAVTLNGDLTATSGSGAITFGSTVSGARNLIVSSSGIKTFSGIVGGTALLSFTTNAAGSTSISANISTAGPIIFNDPVILTANVLISSGVGLVTFGSTVDGPGSLTVNSIGATTFSGALGGNTALLGLTTNAGGTSVFTNSCTSVTTSGAIGINIADPVMFNAALTTLDSSAGNSPIVLTGAVTLNGGLTALSGNGLITFGSTVNGAQVLTAAAGIGTITFSGILGGTTALTSLVVNSAALVNTTSITTTGLIQITPAVSLSANTTYTSSTGDITFGSTIVSGGGVIRTLTLNSTGTTTLTGAVGAGGGTNALSTLTTNAGGIIAVGGNIDTSNAAVLFNGNVTLLGDAVFSTGSGAITFGGTLDGAGNLTLDSTGTTTFNNIIGGAIPLLSLTTNAGGIPVFSATCASVTTSGAIGINIADPVTFNAALTTLDSSAGNGSIVLTGAVTLNGGLTALSGNGLITFGSTVNGAQVLTAAAGTGTITFSGILGGTTALTSLVVNSASLVNMTNVTTTGLIQITPAVSLSANTTYTSSAGDITFGSTIVSGGGVIRTLTLNSTGTTTLTGAVGAGGGTNALSTLTTNVGGTTAVGGNIDTTDAAILFNDNVTLLGDAVFSTGSGAITFGGTLNGAGNLTLNSTGATTFNNIIGGNTPLLSLTTNTGGTSVFAAACTRVTTSGPVGINIGEVVTFNAALTTLDSSADNGPIVLTGAVTLNGDLTIIAGSGAITFGSTLDGAQYVIVNSSGVKTFSGAVHGLLGLTTNALGSTAIGADISIANGPLIFNSPVRLTANTTIDSGTGNMFFGNTVDGPGSLTVISSGDKTFSGIVGGATPLLSFTSDAAGNISIGANISTNNGAMNFNSPVDIAGDAIFSSGTGAITFGNTLNGAHNLRLNSSGVTSFNRIVGGTTPLLSLTMDIGGASVFAAACTGVTTNGLSGIRIQNEVTFNAPLMTLNSSVGNGPIEFTGAVTLNGDLTTIAGSGAITFGSRLNGAGNVIANSSGVKKVTGIIGDTIPPLSLTFDAAGSILIDANIKTVGTLSFNAPVTLFGNSLLNSSGNDIQFNSTLNGGFDISIEPGLGNIVFSDAVGGASRLRNMVVNSANNLRAVSNLNVEKFYQTSGSGTTDFGIINGLNATGEVSINTNIILGKIVGGVTVLNGIQHFDSSVFVSSLSLNGKAGGTLVGTVQGKGGIEAAQLTNLLSGYQGIFTMNGFVLPASIPKPPTDPTVPKNTVPKISISSVVFPEPQLMQFGLHACIIGDDDSIWCH